MVTPVRPGVPGDIQPIPRSDRSAAQRAFFEAALGRSGVGAGQSAPQQTTQSQATQAQATQAQPAAQPLFQTARTGAVTPPPTARAHVQKIPVNLPAEPPARILRPGSLLDIKV